MLGGECHGFEVGAWAICCVRALHGSWVSEKLGAMSTPSMQADSMRTACTAALQRQCADLEKQGKDPEPFLRAVNLAVGSGMMHLYQVAGGEPCCCGAALEIWRRWRF